MKDKGIISQVFAKNVFNDTVMKERLAPEVYKELKDRIKENKPLTLDIADAVAEQMKNWALENGATHFTHWFQPLTGVTAEKHDSFLDIEDGMPIMDFDGKRLIKGEPDASSFPSGGLRATFEARGYTAWDPTSYAFVKDGTLYIPTAFCSYGGEALDKKTPLLRSMEVIDKQALRLVKLFGLNANKVVTTVGAEQEYFLVSKDVYEKRRDLYICGRTLFGAKPPKGQELDDHYFGKIKSQVAEFMKDLDINLWKLGVYSKTKHNEVAPAQHELAPVYGTTNIATDHNQITMAVMKEVANNHGMVCLLHEKPFKGVNGSGKHNNWSISTDTGINLLDPGKNPSTNMRFLLFLTAVISAVDTYQDLLRISVASASNDHRLGANEAPPAIISMFIGEELQDILEAIERGEEYKEKLAVEMQTGVSVITHFNKDKNDRNRTSPFAFTGNKFEFRMPGSMQSIAEPNIVLDTAVGEIFKQYADRLEKAENFDIELKNLIKEEYGKHKRIVFNGNNYSDEWKKEAEKRGLKNYRTTVDAIPHLTDAKNVKLFVNNGVFTESELNARREIMFESYNKQIHIESETMLDMLDKEIIPCVINFKKDLSKELINLAALYVIKNNSLEKDLFDKINLLCEKLYSSKNQLIKANDMFLSCQDECEKAGICKDKIIPAMDKVRETVDSLEGLVGKRYWPLPDYTDILYSVKY